MINNYDNIDMDKVRNQHQGESIIMIKQSVYNNIQICTLGTSCKNNHIYINIHVVSAHNTRLHACRIQGTGISPKNLGFKVHIFQALEPLCSCHLAAIYLLSVKLLALCQALFISCNCNISVIVSKHQHVFILAYSQFQSREYS